MVLGETGDGVCVIYLQSRIVAPDPDTAAEMVREKLEQQGYEVKRLRMWACPVQPYKQIWIEYLARIETNREANKCLIE